MKVMCKCGIRHFLNRSYDELECKECNYTMIKNGELAKVLELQTFCKELIEVVESVSDNRSSGGKRAREIQKTEMYKRMKG